MAIMIAIGLLASASRSLAVTMTWTNGSANWNGATAWTTNTSTSSDGVTTNFCDPVVPSGFTVITNCVGGTGGFPGIGDQARFTNDTSYTVNISSPTTVGVVTFTNTAGTVTLNASGSSMTVTGRMRVADGGATSTVIWSGGTLNVDATTAASVLQLGPNADSFGSLIVTGGTVRSAGSLNVGGAELTGAGKLVISGPGVFTNTIAPNLGRAFRLRTTSQLIVTNGGNFFWTAETRAISNSLILVSDPGSLMVCTNVAGATACLSIGFNDEGAPGSLLIVSNSATLFSDGTVTIGRGGGSAGQFCIFNTGIVTRAGRLIARNDGRVIIGTGSIGGSASNNLTVSDGGYLEAGGATLTIGNSPGLEGNSFNMGGAGAMSTGLVVMVNNNSTAVGSRFVVTNAVFTCTRVNFQGTTGNSVTVLSNGTLNLTGPIVGTTSNNLTINTDNSGTITIDAGTINANAGGSNNITVVINGGGISGGSLLNIINGGKLLSEVGTIGQNSGYNTGIVAGVGSVWSNWSSGVNITNGLTVGGSGSLNTGFNHFAVRGGASLYNNGTLNIGSTNTGPFNTVAFGGVGAASFIRNQGSLNIGGGGQTHGNALLVTNATLDCDILNVGKSETTNNTLTVKGGTVSVGLIRVRASNTVVFAAGTLSAASMDTDPGANDGNVFVVGDGTSAAYYDMAAGGDGYHKFGSPGLVVTNGAFLRGNGTLTGTVVVRGTFVPGFSVGSIYSSNSLSFSGAAVLNYDLGTSSDSVTVNGSLGLGSSVLNVTDSGGFGAGTYVLIQHTNTVTAPSGTLTVGTLPAGFTAIVSNDLPNAQVLLVVTAVGGDAYSTWTTYYGLTGGNALGTADPDGDGMINTNEFLAGFNPTNSTARLRVIGVTKSGNDMNIVYLGANGDIMGSPGPKTNVLEFTTGAGSAGNYTNNFTSTGQTNILSGGTGLGTITNMVDIGGGTNVPSRYYRVRVLTP